MKPILVAGTDPEFMLWDPKREELVSAIGRIPGTKKRPHKIPGGAVQRDNVMCELNTDPAQTREELVDKLRLVLKGAAEIAAPNLLLVQASADFPARALRNRETRRFGCDPDFNAWTLMPNEVPFDAPDKSFRSAGGHFHVGQTAETAEMLGDPHGKVAVVRMLDIFLGLPSVLLDQDPSSPARRQLYGKAGAHRPKPYGVEYRALGNFWLRSPKLVELIYDLADHAVRLTLQGAGVKIGQLLDTDAVQQAINESSIERAETAIRRLAKAKFFPAGSAEEILSGAFLKAVGNQNLYQAWGIQSACGV